VASASAAKTLSASNVVVIDTTIRLYEAGVKSHRHLSMKPVDR
jgi:hypothetical protein